MLELFEYSDLPLASHYARLYNISLMVLPLALRLYMDSASGTTDVGNGGSTPVTPSRSTDRLVRLLKLSRTTFNL